MLGAAVLGGMTVVPELVLDEKMKPSYDILHNYDNLTKQQ